MEPALSVKMVSRDNTEMEKRAWKKNAVTTAYMSMPATGAYSEQPPAYSTQLLI